MSTKATSYRQALNNELQGTKTVTYDYIPQGRLHEQVWLVIVSIDGVEYGRGESLTKNDAKEKASMNAYLQYKRNQG
ncbi:hypothetical protein M408DRAFT_27289 [Serendipita vermifera MAFF 305830]|uniref:DRBM domain-containing protein n=1 Tax=Serendipita vermifera MAFF 305830 TaxID=933852 RepID=A0A0C2WCK1_SERVB|nr:hypothetical protein M408DRAFT_27289 [Serendipita vermifera MAFF 305830]